MVHALNGYLPELSASTEDSLKDVSVASHKVDGHDLKAMMHEGRRGVGADIFDGNGDFKVRQLPVDTSEVKCGVVFRLPPSETTGFLAVHVSNGRSVKSLLADALVRRFREDFPELMLEIKPAALGAAVRQAVNEGRIDRIRLTRLDRPRDRANTGEGKWIPRQNAAQISLEVKGWRGSRLLPDRIKRFLDGEQGVFGEIIEFDGLEFDEAHVEVELGNGQHRTFSLSNPEGGHAPSQVLDIDFDDQGDPVPDTVFAALSDVIDSLPK